MISIRPGAMACRGMLAALSAVCLAATVIDSAYLQFAAILLGSCCALTVCIRVTNPADGAHSVGRGELACCLVGFFLMTLMSIGNPRFVRPLLPAFHLAACLSLPLAVSTLMLVLSRGWRWPHEQVYSEQQS